MIQPNVEQHLGRRSFFLLLSRKIPIGLVLLIVALVAAFVRMSIIQGITDSMKLAGTVSNGTLASISSAVSSVILGLFLVSIMVILVSIIIALLEYRNYAFTFEEFDLKMRRGIFDRREVSLPYRQIQDVDIERDVSHQLLGLSKLVLMTAGHEEAGEHEMAEVLLEPLDKEAAEEIRAMLQRKIGIQVVETEQEADREAVPVK